MTQKVLLSLFLIIVLIFLLGLCAGLSGENIGSNNFISIRYNPRVVTLPTPIPIPTPDFIQQIALLDAQTKNTLALEEARHNRRLDWFYHLVSCGLGGFILLMMESSIVLYFVNRRLNDSNP